MDDELTAERARRSDPASWAAILMGHRERLRRVIAVRLDPRLAPRLDPSDVVQEALAEAVGGLSGYLRDPPLPPFAWLRQVAIERLAKLYRHHIRAQKRSVTREERRADGQAIAEPAAGGSSPSGRLIRDEARQRLRAALDRMSEADRRVIVLRDFQAVPVAEVAAALGVSEGAAKVRHLRALRRLQRLLEGPP
jgi:RNA polymerase sigma-70 factor (ECF subfamily)